MNLVTSIFFLAQSAATMSGEFWMVHHLILFITLISAVIRVIFRKGAGGSLDKLTVCVVIFLVWISVFSYMGREPEQTELDFLMDQLSQGALWAVALGLAYFFIGDFKNYNKTKREQAKYRSGMF